MNVEDWLEVNVSNSLPCPRCNKGKLEFEEGIKRLPVDVKHDIESIKKDNMGLYPDAMEISLSAVMLKCDKCSEYVVMTAKEHPTDMLDPEEVDFRKIDPFEPLYFYPTIMFFQIPKNCPSNIKESVKAAFNLYWVDQSASANKIRIALELLMDNQNVSGRSLHNKIENFSTDNEEIGEYFLGLKWFGNAGSHRNNVRKNDLLQAFELLEFALVKFYGSKEARMSELSQKLIDNKGEFS